MSQPIEEQALETLFRAARTHTSWLDRPVSEETLRQLYDLLKWAPTSANSSPARILFVRSPEAKERLRPALASGNVEKTMAAPVTAIIAYDQKFYERLPFLFPHAPKMKELFVNDPAMAETAAFRNGSLQGAYLILAARSVGLDCGPMSGFDNAKVDEEFFGGAEGSVKSNFLCNLGYGDPDKLFPRGPRLDFEEACQIL